MSTSLPDILRQARVLCDGEHLHGKLLVVTACNSDGVTWSGRKNVNAMKGGSAPEEVQDARFADIMQKGGSTQPL